MESKRLALRKFFSLIAVLLMVLSGSSYGIAAAQDQAAASPSSDPSSGNYLLGVADKVRIIVYNEPSLSGEFIVGDNGSLSLPLIGEVVAKGRSQKVVTEDIQARLADGYLKEPRVSLDVLTYRPFYILGEVAKPGEYPYSSNLTVMNAIARAEGFTYRANKGKVFLNGAGGNTGMLSYLFTFSDYLVCFARSRVLSSSNLRNTPQSIMDSSGLFSTTLK